MDTSSTLDRALDRLHRTDFAYAAGGVDGLSNHGPMAAASLAELGAEDRIEPFVARYLRRLRPLPAPSLAPARLGDEASARAFLATYEAAFACGDARGSLAATLRPLLPGAVAAATHGWLRTAHAAWALAAADTPSRRREMAFGLASWASTFQRVPGDPGSRRQPGLDVARALAQVPLLPPSARREAGLIVDRVAQCAEVDGFEAAVAAVDLDAKPFEATVGVLTRSAARLFLANPTERFVYLHAVTASSALRLVAPHLDGPTARAALGAVFHAVAALHATHGEPDSGASVLREPERCDAPSRESVRARAAASDDDHAVKLGAAALREHAATGDGTFLEVAEAWLAR